MLRQLAFLSGNPFRRRCEPCGAEGSAGGQAGVCTAHPVPGDLVTRRIRNLFSHEDQNSTRRKAQHSPK